MLLARELGLEGRILVCLSGRADKDLDIISRLEASLRSEGDELKLIPYAMAGFPDAARSVEIALRLADCGVGAIEIGIPFSDPLADGHVIQAAGQAALEAGGTIEEFLGVAGAVASASPVPTVIMTYANLVLSYGVERFARELEQLGVAGLIIADLPAEEAGLMAPWLREAGVDPVFLATPTSTEERLAKVCAESAGFVYCVTVAGVTGTRRQLPADLQPFLKRVRQHTSLPLAAGFGISRPEHLKALRGVTDAAIVASALVEEVQAGRDPSKLLAKLVEAGRG